VRELLHKRIRDTFLHPQFNTDVMKPLNIEMLLDQEVRACACPATLGCDAVGLHWRD
jgi:translation initiation factor RLI1